MFSFRGGRAVLYMAALFLMTFASYGGCTAGLQTSGAQYVICAPDAPAAWNGDLILFAHGYVAPGEPTGVPMSQLALPDGTNLPKLITDLGFAFAASSFSKNGLAVLQGVADTVDLITVFKNGFATPRRVFVTGVSEGGLVAVKAMEQNPALFHGGLAACGPVGDFRKQINHFGDVRVLFDYFFQNVLPPSAIDIPPGVIAGWESTYLPGVIQHLQAKPLAAAQLISVADLPIGLNPANAGDAIVSALWYNVFATNDAKSTLGGNPFDNRTRWYRGSLADWLLNMSVARFSAEPAAPAELNKYQTSGGVQRPLITLHTVWDPVVPYWHETLYSRKAASKGKSRLLVQYPVLRYGHCNFNSGDVLAAFLTMVLHPYAQ